jgi:hypothetical protein
MLEQFANIIAPTSLAKLFYTYDNVVGNNVIYIVQDENYRCLIDLGVLTDKDDIIVDTGMVPAFSMPKEERFGALRDMLLREQWCAELIEAIGDDGVDESQLPTFPSYEEQQVQNMLWWMDNLNIITKIDSKYVLANDDVIEVENNNDPSQGALWIGDINLKEDKYSVFDYLRKISRSSINLSPDFQRSLVWSITQKSKFIESAILDIPLPPIYLKREEDNSLIMVDGLQRTACLRDFFAGEFALAGLEMLNLNGYDIEKLRSEYPQYLARLEDKQLQTYIISPSVRMEIVYDIFERINTGGTKLERQEMRNCIYAGKSTRLLKELAETDTFRFAIDNGIMPTRMKDREAILRCLAFVLRDYEREYTGSMDEFLSGAMKMLNKQTDEYILDIKEKALRTFRWAHELYGKHNFRLPTAQTRGRISIAVMETFFYVLWNMSKDDFINHLAELRAIIDDIFDNNEYLVAVKYTTNNKNRVDTRFSIMRDKVNGILQA